MRDRTPASLEIREIMVRVEEGRGGRLARLDELATNLKAPRASRDGQLDLPRQESAHARPVIGTARCQKTRRSALQHPFSMRLRLATQQTSEPSLWQTCVVVHDESRTRRLAQPRSRPCEMKVLESLMSPRMCCQLLTSAARKSFPVTMS